MADKDSVGFNPEHPQPNKFKQFLSESSQRFLATFLDDDIAKKERRQHIFKLINQAIAQKSIVVIQYKDLAKAKQADKYETLVGRLYQHPSNPESLVVKLQKDNQVKMISAQYIKKISLINPDFSRHVFASK